ncbi:MAG TPA: DUF4468 domain-containing protein [Stenomitos sp.]
MHRTKRFIPILIISLIVIPLAAAGEGMYSLNKLTTVSVRNTKLICVKFSPDGSQFVTGGEDKLVTLWDTASGQQIKNFKGHKDDVQSVIFSKDGKMIISGDRGGNIIVWDSQKGNKLQEIKLSDDINQMSINGNHLAVAVNSKKINVIDLMSQPTKITGLEGHKNDIKAVTFTRDGSLLVTGSDDKSIMLWDLSKGKMTKELKGHADDILSVALSSNGKLLASGSDDKRVLIWDLETSAIKKTLLHSNKVVRVAFIEGDKTLLSAEGNGDKKCRIRFWDVESGSSIFSERGDCSLTDIDLNPDENLIAVAAKNVSIYKRIPAVSQEIEPDPNGPLEFTEVVQVPNAKATELFPLAHEWFVNTFVSANNVLQMIDKENGILIGKGSISYEPNTFMSSSLLRGWIQFTAKVIVKDGRYKFVFTDFRHSGSPAVFTGLGRPILSNAIIYGLLTNSESPPDGILYRKSVWEHMKEVASISANEMADSLRTQMNKPSKNKTDW